MKNAFLFVASLCIICSCATKDSSQSIEKWKQEIFETEQNFATMVQNEGIHNAFVAYADENAVVMRNNAIVKGKKAIDEFYKNSNSKNLSWTPNFIEVSNSGDLGYTYGSYQFTFKDSLGVEQINSGIFHTVWKRQQDGTWKFVWD